MAYDFNNETEQKKFVSGPIPAGSIVLLQLKLEQPYGGSVYKTEPFVGKTKTGLFQLNCSFHVVTGTYESLWWYDNILLPAGIQKGISDKQKKACGISAARIRAIIEASRGINPSDKSDTAIAKRSISSWSELDGMSFPAQLTINPQPREYEGKEYWHNRVDFIITPDQPEYKIVLDGGEYINENGAVTGTGSPYRGKEDVTPSEDPFSNNANYGNAPQMDDMPF